MYKKRQKGWIKHADFLLLDLLCMCITFYLGYAARHGLDIRSGPWVIYWRLLGILAAVDLCVALFRESYKSIVRRGYFEEIKQTVVHCAIVDVILLIYMFLVKETENYSRESLLVFCVLQIACVYIARCLRKYQLRVRMKQSTDVEQMLVVVDGQHAKRCLKELTRDLYQNYRVIGAMRLEDGVGEENVEEEQERERQKEAEERAEEEPERAAEREAAAAFAETVPRACTMEQLSEYLLNHVVDSVFIDAEMPEEKQDKLVNLLVESGVTVHISLIHVPHGLKTKSVERIGNYVVLTTGMRLVTLKQIVLKRLLDIAGGLFGCLITVLAAILFAPIIYVQSPGPIFFTQNRVGKNGRIFKIYKFRSMYPDAEEQKQELLSENKMNGLMFKMQNDPRILPIGKFLRKYSIDELPQFFNVLKGDMSLVGTRPPTVEEFEQYELHHRGRLNARPGITGLWQVSGRSDITDFEEVVEMDTQYIENWTIAGDIRILGRTVLKVFSGDGM
ncbi:MAG: sugar transferase [Clostridiaceae bacterium]|nr:sugar transferase [Clostridiaceae bacterium]